MKFDKILIENEMYLKKVSFYKKGVKISVKYLTIKQIKEILNLKLSKDFLLSEILLNDFLESKINNKGFIYL